MAKEVLYSSIETFKDFNGVVYVEQDTIARAREVLDKVDYKIVGMERSYDLEGGRIIDFNGLGLRIQYDDELKFNGIKQFFLLLFLQELVFLQ